LLINGGGQSGNGAIDGLLGVQILNMMGDKFKTNPVTTDVPVEEVKSDKKK
jgi:hypothetical protein